MSTSLTFPGVALYVPLEALLIPVNVALQWLGEPVAEQAEVLLPVAADRVVVWVNACVDSTARAAVRSDRTRSMEPQQTKPH
jgi:hypothetical protein